MAKYTVFFNKSENGWTGSLGCISDEPDALNQVAVGGGVTHKLKGDAIKDIRLAIKKIDLTEDEVYFKKIRYETEDSLFAKLKSFE